ncbi:putative quinol monooxygenase [Sphingobium sp. V4]|uniref:putative quinol monooxygenase n=1 Tax=Sphingobium sp. V4 TaxID=3038927 RepID=UPI002557F990|nr:putative quinol monooxygenase [Sphingobium sp. V4]WIW87323.1 putative quinol monooxygenase [Sphingobium sp. V4]
MAKRAAHGEKGWFADRRLSDRETTNSDSLSIVSLPVYIRVMLLIVGTVRLPAQNMEAARPIMKRMADASRAEEGCIEYGYAEDVFEPGLIHVKEMWVDQTALDRHFAASHLNEWRAAWPSLGIGDRNLRVYDVAESRST